MHAVLHRQQLRRLARELKPLKQATAIAALHGMHTHDRRGQLHGVAHEHEPRRKRPGGQQDARLGLDQLRGLVHDDGVEEGGAVRHEAAAGGGDGAENEPGLSQTRLLDEAGRVSPLRDGGRDGHSLELEDGRAAKRGVQIVARMSKAARRPVTHVAGTPRHLRCL